jgi:antitoxin component of RelBE/YafQ-DinJ toxin-antitoxin module
MPSSIDCSDFISVLLERIAEIRRLPANARIPGEATVADQAE